jgi:lysophospholipase L1-like esterase
MEDLTQGVGTESQSRNGQNVNVRKIDVPYSVTSTAEMSALDVTTYTRARVYTTTTSFIDYVYDPVRVDGISSTGPGTWIQAVQDVSTVTDITFLTIADMQAGKPVGGVNGQVTFKVGQALKINGENDLFDCYTVVNTAADINLGSGLYAKKLKLQIDSLDDTVISVQELEAVNRIKSIMGVNVKRAAAPWGAAAPINNLGDSISHGAFAGELYYNGWTRILSRMLGADFGGAGYQGYVPMLTLGGGTPNESRDIHSIAFVGTWNAQDSSTSSNGAAAYNGLTFQSTNQTDYIRSIIPSFQTKGLVWYLQQPGGGDIEITVNGAFNNIISTAGPLATKAVLVAHVDDGQGSCAIKVEKKDASAAPVDVIGFGYIDEIYRPVLHNFANSGRRLRYVDEQVIADMSNNSSIFMLSLGHNDQGDVDADPNGVYAQAFKQRIDWIIQYCNANNTVLVVNDFCWTAADTSYTRQELKRAAKETMGIYIPFPNLIKPDGTVPDGPYITGTINMWADTSHPNADGNKWIAETIAKYLGLSVSSKQSAVMFHDYWMPFAIPAGTNNVFTNPGNVSAYRINGNEVNFRYAVQKAPGGSFPVGTHSLQTGWRVDPPFITVGTSQTLPGFPRSDTSVLTSTLNLGLAGAVDLNVTDGSWINAQQGQGKLGIALF